MLRIDTTDRTTSLPTPPAKGAQDGYFRPKNAGLGQLGTILPFYFMNFIQESLRHTRVAAGVSEPANWETFDWLTASINALAAAGVASSVLSKSSAYTVIGADKLAFIKCTSTFTLSLTAAATLGSGWFCFVRNDGTGVITIDPNAAELIDGFATKTLGPRETAMIFCDGTGFKTIGNMHLPLVSAKSSGYTALTDDMGGMFNCTASLTLALTAAATLGNGWWCYVRNDSSSGVVTIDPDASETIDGFTTITLGPGAGCLIFCDGTGFKTIGRNTIEYIHLQDQKSQNTAGGTFTSGAWRTRDLNTEVADTGNNCALSSNQFTLQPGTYRIRASAPAATTNAHQAKLRNTSDSSDVLLGSSEYAHNSYGLTTRSFVTGQFTIAAAKTFELQHQCGMTQSTTGFGQAANFGTEIYSVVELWKVA